MNIEKQLQQLQTIKASSRLHDRIHSGVGSLGTKHRGFYLPLFAFQGTVIMGILLILLGLGSGLVAAAHFSRPGNVLYPIKVAIEKVTPTPLERHTTISAKRDMTSPTPIPTILLKRVTPEGQVSLPQKQNESQAENKDKKEGVQGISDTKKENVNKQNDIEKRSNENIFQFFEEKFGGKSTNSYFHGSSHKKD